MRAADLLVECLVEQGADRLFCVPGESYLALLDALHAQNSIDLVVCRHEGGAGMMAVADAKLTGRPGLLAVSRGPGATNAAIAIHLADQDAVPLVMLVGQVARAERGRGAFQEVDYTQMFGGMAKRVWEVTQADRLPDTLAAAWHAARSGTPGPVVVVLPEDLLGDEVDVPVVPALPLARGGPSGADIERVRRLLDLAERPLLVVGGGLASPRGREALAELARAHHIPVATTFKHQEIFDAHSPLFAGHLGFKVPRAMVGRLSEADLILAVGTRLGDTPTQGWRLPHAPDPTQPLVHVWPDPARLGAIFRTEVGLACDPAAFCEALVSSPPEASSPRHRWAERLNAPIREARAYQPRQVEDGLDFGEVVAEIAARAPRDTIVTTDAGNFSSWVHVLWPWRGDTPAIGAAGGVMGLGVPGAVAASLRHPGRCVIGFVGDGGILMTGSELATATAFGATPKIVVCDNGTYGTIRLHQERAFPSRVSGTALSNPDFAAWGASFGALGLSVGPGDDIAASVERFLSHDGAAVLAVRASAELIAAGATISGLRDRRS